MVTDFWKGYDSLFRARFGSSSELINLKNADVGLKSLLLLRMKTHSQEILQVIEVLITKFLESNVKNSDEYEDYFFFPYDQD